MISMPGNTEQHDHGKGPTSLIPAFEEFLARKGMPRPYLPLYSVLAHRLVHQFGVERLKRLNPEEAATLVAQTAKPDDSAHNISNKQKVVRALVRYLSTAKRL